MAIQNCKIKIAIQPYSIIYFTFGVNATLQYQLWPSFNTKVITTPYNYISLCRADTRIFHQSSDLFSQEKYDYYHQRVARLPKISSNQVKLLLWLHNHLRWFSLSVADIYMQEQYIVLWVYLLHCTHVGVGTDFTQPIITAVWSYRSAMKFIGFPRFCEQWHSMSSHGR